MRSALLAVTLLILAACSTPAEEQFFPIDTAGLPEAKPMEAVKLSSGSVFDIEASTVQKNINGTWARMYGYNGQIPGPVLRVQENSTVTIRLTNSIDQPTTAHWHGIRLRNEYDGVPDLTQKAVQPGETFTYEVTFPDDGIFWYHPHVREDVQQELGLYGAIIVEPKTDYARVDQEAVLILDDIRIFEGLPEPFMRDSANYALMGRFGNQPFINGMQSYSLSADAGETIRFFVLNAANTRFFNISINGAMLKIIGNDAGLYEQDFLADSVIIAPSERRMLEARFNVPGIYKLMHRTSERSWTLGTITVNGEPVPEDNYQLLANEKVMREVDRMRPFFDAPPDYTVDLTIDMENGAMHSGMHADKPIEWEDDMVMMNFQSTSDNTRWILRDRETGKENMDIRYKVRKGDIKKIRFINDPRSAHPMQHPIHLHGQSFLVIAENGKQVANHAWKDVVVVPTGATVDILVAFDNPGEWMFHCHIAEHLESGMMGIFEVIE